jgi:hypothetical protein
MGMEMSMVSASSQVLVVGTARASPCGAETTMKPKTIYVGWGGDSDTLGDGGSSVIYDWGDGASFGYGDGNGEGTWFFEMDPDDYGEDD